MKTSTYLTLLFTIISMLFVVVSCNKELDLSEQFQATAPLSLDEDAGTWDPIVLASNDAIAVPAPDDVESNTYQAELAAIKKIQKSLTKEQKEIIQYWSVGGIIRWNQFLRELVARFNLPPAPKADNTYPAPDADNPFSDPMFPFANPPYAARAYSYVSVAQYEAMKAAWHYKYQYNRKAPYHNDNDIKAMMPETDLPAYPSEDAVLSGVSAEMMKLLFPAAVEEITKKAAEQRNAALWSGKASTSDITAGLALGKAIATQVTARASGDGMKNAAGNATQWKAFEQTCIEKNETPWYSLETPARPPMLPFFCNVTGWCMTFQDFVDHRPAAPPSTSSAEMKKEVEEVKWYANNIDRKRLAIVHKWADGAGTYTPPGHWNDIATEFISGARFSEVRAARAYALLNMAMHDAAIGCWETKFYYFNPRPSQMDPSIKTSTGVPNFPAYTSGHSTFSSAAATVLSYLFPEGEAYFQGQAEEASISRLYGAIHYRSDIEMGQQHGKVIGDFTVDYAQTDGADD